MKNKISSSPVPTVWGSGDRCQWQGRHWSKRLVERCGRRRRYFSLVYRVKNQREK